MLSGLSNCTIAPAERDLLRQIWSAKLNEHHLFRKSEDALEFGLTVDERAPEHAPFFTFGIYLLAPQ